MWVAHQQGLHKINNLFGGEFSSFCEKYFEIECSIKKFTFKLKKNLKTTKKQHKLSQLPTERVLKIF
jgi:hypothetical protein